MHVHVCAQLVCVHVGRRGVVREVEELWKEKQNRRDDSNLPKIKEGKGWRLGFPWHLGESCALLGHLVARRMLLTG